MNVRQQQAQLEEKEARKESSGEKSKIERIEAWIMARYEVRRNTVLNKVEIRSRDDDGDDAWRVMSDTEENNILYELNRANFTKPEGMMNIILGSGRIECYNPIDDFFRRTRLTTMGNIKRLLRCVELDPSIDQTFDGRTYRELFDDYMTKWLKACYFCMTGRKFNDVMLILVGAQGTRKTSFLNHLTPPDLASYSYTGHMTPSLSDYNTASYLVEKIFINVDDQMENIFGKDYNSMKSIISQDTVTRRVLYRRHSQQQKRIANFCGSVNESGFLMDSNNRRYLCFQVAAISEEYASVDTAQLWAEVAELCREENASIYQFDRHDYAVIDLIDDLCAAPLEETELLNTCFEPVRTYDDETYYLQFSEILAALKRVGDNSGLRPYNLKTALRKYKFTARPIRRPERGNMPLRLYAVHIKHNCPEYIWIANKFEKMKDGTTTETLLPEPDDRQLDF